MDARAGIIGIVMTLADFWEVLRSFGILLEEYLGTSDGIGYLKDNVCTDIDEKVC